MSKRRTHSPEFKARVAMEAISGRKTIQQIAADHAIHPIQVSQWKRQLLDGASELFTRGKQTKDREEGKAKEAELFQQIGRLQMELEWLKKISAAVRPMTYESALTMRIQISRSAVNVNSWDCHAQPSITSPSQCGNPRCGSWRESMPFFWRIHAAGAGEWWTTWLDVFSHQVIQRSAAG
jgi:transposase-like protein